LYTVYLKRKKKNMMSIKKLLVAVAGDGRGPGGPVAPM
jgi:hypothetical protein